MAEEIKEIKKTETVEAEVVENDENTTNHPDTFEIVDVETVESQEEVAADIFIKTITPYKIIFTKKDNKDIAILMFLCRDDNDKLFIIDRNIIINDEDHLDNIKCIPFAEDEFDFENEKICYNLLMGYLDNYICDMKFEISKEDINKPNPLLKTTLTNVKSRETKLATIRANTYAALKFIDSYIDENIINEHDLALATLSGSKDNENSVEFFLVDSVEKIVAMASASVDLNTKKKNPFTKIKLSFSKNKKNNHNTSIGIVIKVSRIVGTEKEVVQLLTPFDIGIEFGPKKFKGITIPWIEDNYYGDSDQYVSTITINSTRLEGIDKNFMIIRGRSKNGSIKLFLLDSSIQKELQDMINEY